MKTKKTRLFLAVGALLLGLALAWFLMRGLPSAVEHEERSKVHDTSASVGPVAPIAPSEEEQRLPSDRPVFPDDTQPDFVVPPKTPIPFGRLPEEEERRLKLQDFHAYLRYKQQLEGPVESSASAEERKVQARERLAKKVLEELEVKKSEEESVEDSQP